MFVNKTFLVTGGTGFVGSHFVEMAVQLGITNLYVTQLNAKDSYVASLIPKENVIQLNLTDKLKTRKIFEAVQPDYIVHLAAFAAVGDSFDSAEEILSNNIALQLSVLEAMKDITPHSRLLAVGSSEAYGMSFFPRELPIREEHVFRPINPYGVSKISQEMLAYSYHLSHKLDIVRVRPFNHTGVRQSNKFFVPALAERIVAVERGEAAHVTVGNLEAKRDVSDVVDVVRAYLVLLQKGVSGEVYNVGAGRPIAMQDIFDQMTALSTVTIRSVVDPNLLRPSDIAESYASLQKIKQLGWSSKIPLSQTLQNVLEEKRQQL